MSSVIDIALVVIALSLLALIFLLIRFLLEVRSLALTIKTFLERAQTDLLPVVSNLAAISVQIKDISAQAGKGISKLSDLFVAIGEGAHTVRLFNSILRGFLPSSVIGAASFVVGVKAGLAVLMNHLIRRR